ncbi:DUF6057 family protein [Prolixibacteraceae bacterium Z1-6]|uniref:DUF6057 family protein n=1 Tax=Draconibacterium aestuarii TaxID=2998507 RepID=A0A9X3J8V3_9BACT|nr:DUF6057 family protein [Prolixibacteraceae bacterium Z1-6]
MGKSEKIWNGVIAAEIAVVSFLFFQFFYAYHLFFKEQILLFIYTPDYLLSYFSKPGWLTCLTGDFLTQFFYLRGGGPFVLAALFSIEWILSYLSIKKISKSQLAKFWAVLPVIADFVSHLSLAHTARISTGLILVLLLFLFYSGIKNKYLATVVAVIFSIAGHWFIGSAAFVFPVLVLLHKLNSKYFVPNTLLLPLVFVLPLLIRGTYLLPLNETLLFPATQIEGLLPLAVFLFVLVIEVILQKTKTRPLFVKLSIGIIGLALAIGGFKNNVNFNREKIFALDSETYFGNTKKVIELAGKSKFENRFLSYYTNMALAKTGQLPHRLLEFYQPAIHGLILPVSQQENWQTILFSNELFYLLGDMNLAQHSSMLGNTFSPYQRSSRMMKRLAEINMVNGDYPGAEKFLRILGKTLFHKKWVRKKSAENNAHCNSNWLIEKRTQIAHSDTIRNSFDYIESIEFLVQQNPHNLIALDYLLSYYLLNKDLVSFKTAYDKYVKSLKRPVPKVYGEALLVKLFQDKVTQKEVLDYRIGTEQMRGFADYTNFFKETRLDIERSQDKFGDTYWFYYHFATFKEN